MHHAVVGSAFPPDMTGTLLVLRAYFDESGTNPGSRLVTMVGVLATPKRWRLLSRAWWAVLERHGVKGEFKADECVRGLAPPYNGWSPRERLAFRARLGSLIDEHAVYASVVSMLRADFD